MPRHETISIGATWTELSAGDVTEFTLQNLGTVDMFINFTVGNASPPADPKGIKIDAGVPIVKATVADLSLGVAGANRVWGRALGPCQVFVTHA